MNDPSARISALLDDALGDKDFPELQAWLLADGDHLRQFVTDSFIHSRLYDILIQRDLGGLAFGLESHLNPVDPQNVRSLLDEHEEIELRQAREAAEAAAREAAAKALSEKSRQPSAGALERRSGPRGVYAIWATLAATLLLVWSQWTPDPPAADRSPPPTPRRESEPLVAIAALEEQIGGVWAANSPAPLPGETLDAGRYELTDGVIKLAFDAGATVVVQAPAAFELDKANRIRLSTGQAVAAVPPEALGFLLTTPAASFLDLGTEFGVDVDDGGGSTVHVLDGEIAVVQGERGAAGGSRTVREGQAQQISADGASITPAPFEGARFIRAVPRSLYELEVLRSEPLAYWPLQADFVESRSQAPEAAGNGVTLESSADRDGPSGYAEFADGHDGIEVVNAAALDLTRDLTCEAWAFPVAGPGAQRIFSNFNRLPRAGFAFGVGDGRFYGLQEPGLRLQFTAHGRYDCLSYPEAPAGRWVHLAVVVGPDGMPRLFMGGDPVKTRVRGNGQQQWSDEFTEIGDLVGRPSRGAAQIGRSPAGDDGEVPPERWRGRLSCVALYDRALPADELSRHAAAGLPRIPAGATPRAPAASPHADVLPQASHGLYVSVVH